MRRIEQNDVALSLGVSGPCFSLAQKGTSDCLIGIDAVAGGQVTTIPIHLQCA